VLRNPQTTFTFQHTIPAAKRLRYKLGSPRGQHNRRPLYKRLIDAARKTVAYAQQSVTKLDPDRFKTFEERVRAGESLRRGPAPPLCLKHYTRRCSGQDTVRRFRNPLLCTPPPS